MLLVALALAAGVGAADFDDRFVIRPSAPDNRPECQALRQQIRAAEPARKELLAGRDRPAATKLVMRTLTMENGCVVPPPEAFHPTYLLPGHADAPKFRPMTDRDPPR